MFVVDKIVVVVAAVVVFDTVPVVPYCLDDDVYSRLMVMIDVTKI